MMLFHPVTGLGSRPQGARPLAGSRYAWFDGDGCDAEQTDGFASLRPDLCGLTLDRPRIMGILNVTPDSFSDGGKFEALERALAQARSLADFSDILDIGGESTRPGAEPVPAKEEIARTVPVIAAIRDAGLTIPISIDTRKAVVAEAALDAGADFVNDVSAMTYDAEMPALVAERRVAICLMHAQGDPRSMQNNPSYGDVVSEVYTFLHRQISAAQEAGLPRENVIVDPGIGFGKTLQHNVTLLRSLSVLHGLGCAVLLGASRKRFIGTIGQAAEAADRMPGSLAVALHGAAQGVQILRVHDARETRQALQLWQALNGGDDD